MNLPTFKILVAGLSVFALASCVSEYDRQYGTVFEPQADGGFHFKAHADATLPLDSAQGEKTRIGWLEKWLSDSGMCKDGYQITQRQPIVRSKGIGSTMYIVHYYGRCTG